MGNLGSGALGFLAFLLLTPVRGESGHVDCVQGVVCPGSFSHCYTLLGWQDVLGPLSCSAWGAAAAGLAVGVIVRGVGRWREQARPRSRY